MPLYLITCIVTTAIAILSVYFASGARMQQRLLPWTAGVLLGVSVFWILPEIAGDRGWVVALAGVFSTAMLLAAIDRFAYPICPFCIQNLPHDPQHRQKRFARCPVRSGWPLLMLGCIHCFFDGWAIALASIGSATGVSLALSCGVLVHKVPESVAVGLIASRLTSTRARALMTVGLIQISMLSGSLFTTYSGYRSIASLEVLSIPACACLLLFGLLALEDEWRYQGIRPAIRAVVPGLFGCGIAALATHILTR